MCDASAACVCACDRRVAGETGSAGLLWLEEEESERRSSGGLALGLLGFGCMQRKKVVGSKGGVGRYNTRYGPGFLVAIGLGWRESVGQVKDNEKKTSYNKK